MLIIALRYCFFKPHYGILIRVIDMKKSIALFLSVLMMICTLLPISVTASSILMGDVNSSGKVEASDARLVLRASVGLETFSDELSQLADIDNTNTVTAADARMILRMSVGLEELIYIGSVPTDSYFEVHFIDVGQADCSLVLCDDKSLLIDGGNVADSSLVVSYLLNLGIESLDYVICTHAHEDHVGGLNGPLNKFKVNCNIFAPATGASTKCYKDFIDAVSKQDKSLTIPNAGYSFMLGSAEVKFLGPVREDYSDINNTSIVTKITYKNTSFLFTGDAETEAEADILDAGFDVSADVLKVGHHGSENSTSYRFLRDILPSIAVISVGANNDYGHPTEEALSRLRDADVKVYRTDVQGNIIISSDGNRLSVVTEKNQNAETNPTVPAEPANSYIGNKNSKIFHLPTCSTLPKESNRVYFTSRNNAVSDGFTACSRCKP